MEDVINLLLVDDETRNLDALEAILDEPGYRLIRANNADLALHELLANDIAAIVLDIKMPGVSGFELASLIKGMKRYRQIPILFLTAYLLEDEDVLAGYGAGAVDYLTKPIKPAILRHKIGVFADLFRKTRALAQLNDTLEERVKDRTQELETSEDALRAANTALRAADQQKDQFIATLAHELRNPLAPLRTGLDLLIHNPDAPVSSASRAINAMNRQLDHMVRLIDDLLDVSRVSRGLMELRREPVALSTIINHAVEAARPFLEKRRQRVSVIGSGANQVDADPTRVVQIVGNLLHNASKFSPDDTQIRIEVAADADDAILRVIDAGVGIAPEDQSRIFDMFAAVGRPSPSGSSGLGIGLALARRLAELHGGSLTVASEGKGSGATFTLTLKSAVVPVATDSEPTEERTENGHKKLAIVVIEDNEDAAETLVMWLEEMGHQVQLARDGLEGVDLVRSSQPELVLCDIGLPGIDGVEVCRRVKALGSLAQPVMVALTGWGMDADRKRTRDAGFDHHLVKPVAPDKLRNILAAVRTANANA